jgi:hypothetical protein
MGSKKQAESLIKIINSIRLDRMLGNLPADKTAAYTAQVLAMAQPQVQAEFDRYNAITGFSVSEPATVDQRKLIARLETGVYGKPKTRWTEALSFVQAHELLDSLIAMRTEAAAGVRELETFANSLAIASEVDRELL